MDWVRGGGHLTVDSDSKRAWIPFWTWIAFFAFAITAGYMLFRLFASGAFPGTTQLILLAVVAGAASFFSPCAFPLLPGYMSFYYAADQRQPGGAGSWLRLGGAAALGVIAFALLLGLLIAAFGAGLASSFSISGADPSLLVLALRILLGIALLVLGIGQLRGWNLKPTIADRFAYAVRPKRESVGRSGSSLFLVGFGYTVAGLGCTGPILAGLVLGAVASGGSGSALSAFLAFALTMGLLMLLVSGLVAASRDTLISRLKSQTPKVERVAGLLLILVGAFNILSSVYLSQFQSLLFPA
ncbi:MAG: cytochrome c biogenesis CcdA family protein [Anaerolineales bacterium]